MPADAAWRLSGARKIDSNLLNELRIEGQQREDQDAGMPRGAWPLLALIVLLLAGVAGWWFSTRPILVQTVAAIAPRACR